MMPNIKTEMHIEEVENGFTLKQVQHDTGISTTKTYIFGSHAEMMAWLMRDI